MLQLCWLLLTPKIGENLQGKQTSWFQGYQRAPRNLTLNWYSNFSVTNCLFRVELQVVSASANRLQARYNYLNSARLAPKRLLIFLLLTAKRLWHSANDYTRKNVFINRDMTKSEAEAAYQARYKIIWIGKTWVWMFVATITATSYATKRVAHG